MPVYVDQVKIPFRGMLMSHMLADTLDELHGMADLLGIPRSRFQPRSTPHYDVCQDTRAQAIVLGARVINRRETAELIRRLREARERGYM